MHTNHNDDYNVSGDDTLPGVGCDVTSCKYNDDGVWCQAPGIMVESQSTNCKTEIETFCSTYETKSY